MHYPAAPCGDVAPPIDGTWGCLLRRPPKEDRGHPQAHVRLSKATWGNLIATRYKSSRWKRSALTAILDAITLPTSWMGYANGGYFASECAPVAFRLAAHALIVSVAGAYCGPEARWRNAALGLFAAHTA
jgi:hypothetical protein